MNIRKAFTFILILCSLVQIASAADSWTIMIYMNGDNNLEEYALDDFLEIASVGSTTGLNIVVQMDRIGGDSSSYDDWTDTRRFLVNKGDTPVNTDSHDSATYNISIGEQNMGDLDTLVSFFTWAVDSYPAEHYMLVIWDHGKGWRSTRSGDEVNLRSISDDYTSSDSLYYTTGELRMAFEQMIAHLGRPLDIAGFDVCLNQMLENAYYLYTYCDYLVGSEDSEWGEGWSYWYFLEALVQDIAGTTPEELSSLIVEAYANGDDGANNSNPLVTGNTQSALRTEHTAELVSAFNHFSVLYSHYNTGGYKALIDSFKGDLAFYPSPPYYGEYADLGNLLSEAAAAGISEEMTFAAERCLSLLNDSMVDTFSKSGYVSSGLSLYYPDYTSISPIYKNTELAKDTFWDSFLASVVPYEAYALNTESSDNGGDGTIDPGESFTYTISIENKGNFTHDTFTITISDADGFSDIHGTPAVFIRNEPFSPGETFSVILDSQIITDYAGFGSEEFNIDLMGTFLGEKHTYSGYLNVGEPLVLMVDDDAGYDDELPIIGSLDRLNINYSVYSIKESGDTFPDTLLDGYSVVIWNTGIHNSSTLFKKNEIQIIEEFVDNGGGILISSRNLLKMTDAVNSNTTTAFVSNYLGVEDYSKEPFRYEKALRGIFADPVTEGVTLHLADATHELSIWDTDPAAGSAALFSDDYDRFIGTRTPRYSSGDVPGKVIFMPFPLDKAVNNDELDDILWSSVEWLRGVSLEKFFDDSKVLAYPNPASKGVDFTEILLQNIIEIYDISGNLITTLEEGPHHWDLTNSSGKDVSNGIYIYIVRDGNNIIYSGKVALIRN